MSDNKIIKQIVDKFKNSKLTILNENVENQTMEIHVYFQGIKERKGPMTTTNIEKILSKFQSEIITNVITIMTDFKSEVKSDMVKIDSKIEKLNSRLDQVEEKIKKLDSKVDNLKVEMNDRFDKLETRVSTLENFHKKDLNKN